MVDWFIGFGITELYAAETASGRVEGDIGLCGVGRAHFGVGIIDTIVSIVIRNGVHGEKSMIVYV